MTEEKHINKKWFNLIELMTTTQPPWRPGGKQIAFYEPFIAEYAANHPGAEVLILGSTPQIRDLCSKYRLAVTCLDLHPPMYEGMTNNLEVSPHQEKLVVGEWEQMDTHFSPQQFDIIFGDEIHSNIKLELWEKTFQDVKTLLKPSGLFCVSFLGLADNTKPVSFDQVVSIYRRDPSYFANFQNLLELFYGLMLGEDCYNHALKACLFHELKDKFIAYGRSHDLSLADLQQMWPVPRDITEEVIGQYFEIDPPLAEIHNYLDPHFAIQAVYSDPSHTVHNMRQDFILKVK